MRLGVLRGGLLVIIRISRRTIYEGILPTLVRDRRIYIEPPKLVRVARNLDLLTSKFPDLVVVPRNVQLANYVLGPVPGDPVVVAFNHNSVDVSAAEDNGVVVAPDDDARVLSVFVHLVTLGVTVHDLFHPSVQK